MTNDTIAREGQAPPTREVGLDALPLAITPSGVDPERLMLADLDTSPAPKMTIAELALLLNRTTYWIRWQEPKESWPVLLRLGGHYILSKDKKLYGPFSSPEAGVQYRQEMKRRREEAKAPAPGPAPSGQPKPIKGDKPLVGDGRWYVLEVPGKLREGSYETEASAREDLGQQPIGGRTDQGARTYTLSQLEELIHYLARRGKMSGQHAAYALSVVYSLALVYGYLKPTAESVVVQAGGTDEPE